MHHRQHGFHIIEVGFPYDRFVPHHDTQSRHAIGNGSDVADPSKAFDDLLDYLFRPIHNRHTALPSKTSMIIHHSGSLLKRAGYAIDCIGGSLNP